jgi:type II secretory pathway component PulF
MPLYNYKAKKGPQEIIENTIEAESHQEVITKLTQQGLYPIQIELLGKVTPKTFGIGSFFARISARDLNIFTHQLASLIKSGLPLLSALHIIAEQTANKYLCNIIDEIAQSIKHGEMLSSAMSRYPKIFPPIYTAMIKSGEDSGALDIILKRLAEHREKVEEIKSRIRSALAYPILILLVGIASVIFLMMFLVPKIKNVFDTIRAELPLPTQILIGISNALSGYWYLFIGGIALGLIILKGITFIDKKAIDHLKLSLPFIGKFIKKTESAKLVSSLSLLLANGISMLASLEIVIPTLSNEVLKKALRKITDDIKVGGSLSKGIRDSPYFFTFIANMIKVGEESGHLDEILAELASFYEREISETIKIALSLLEPVLILVMGLVVGFIVLSILLPILQITLTAQ